MYDKQASTDLWIVESLVPQKLLSVLLSTTLICHQRQTTNKQTKQTHQQLHQQRNAIQRRNCFDH